jgi:hypothetical protein
MAPIVSKKHETIKAIGENNQPPFLNPIGKINTFIVVYPLIIAQNV